MSLDKEILIELVQENKISLKEASYFVSSRVKKILNDTPKVTKKELVAEAKPGDIVVSFTAKKTITKYLTARISAKIMASIQASPYTSSKLVGNDGNVLGFGIIERDNVGSQGLEKFPFSKYVRARSEICLIRIPNASEAQKQKVIKYHENRIGLPYANLDLYKSIWNRFIRRKILPFFKKKELDQKVLETLKQPLFCSTMISVAFASAGFKKQFNNKFMYDVWPRDFIISDTTEKVCRIEY